MFYSKKVEPAFSFLQAGLLNVGWEIDLKRERCSRCLRLQCWENKAISYPSSLTTEALRSWWASTKATRMKKTYGVKKTASQYFLLNSALAYECEVQALPSWPPTFLPPFVASRPLWLGWRSLISAGLKFPIRCAATKLIEKTRNPLFRLPKNCVIPMFRQLLHFRVDVKVECQLVRTWFISKQGWLPAVWARNSRSVITNT